MFDRRYPAAALLAAAVLSATGVAHAGSIAGQVEGLDALQEAVEAEVNKPKLLSKRRFIVRYDGALDNYERFALDLEPKAAFTLVRQDERTFLVRVSRPAALLQEDFLSKISIRAARESVINLVGTGRGRCALAVRFDSDLGREVSLERYRQVDIEWTPQDAARLVGRGRGHVLFRRNEGYGRTPVRVRARLTLGDGSTRTTEPTQLGFCSSSTGSRLGLLVGGGGGGAGPGFEGFGEVAVPVELALSRAHLRLGPALLARDRGLGVVGQALLGHRWISGLGVRAGGEAGVTSGDGGGFRGAGIVEGFWGLDSAQVWELGLRGRIGSEAGNSFGEIMATLSVLPFDL